MARILYQNQSEYLDGFLKKGDALIAEMEQYAKEKNVPILSRDSAEFIEKIIMIADPKRVLEIGTAIAYTAIRAARVLSKKGIVHTIEKSRDNIRLAKDYISRSGAEKRITLYEGEASDVLPALRKKYDLIFLDADKQDYLKLLDLSVKMLKKGGILFVDNLLWHGYAASAKVPDNYRVSTELIREFNNAFINHPKLDASILPIGDGIGLGIKRKKK